MDLRGTREALKRELDAIREARGELTPQIVVDEARPKNHPLHNRFEWNDKVAGEAYRIVQAHRLMASVKITYVAPSGEIGRVRHYHAVRTPAGTRSYVSAEEIVEDEFTLKLLLQDMERDWRQLLARYQRFAEFAEMVRGSLDELEAG